MSESVLVSVDDHIAVITVNDPDRRNAVTFEMSAALRRRCRGRRGQPRCPRGDRHRRRQGVLRRSRPRLRWAKPPRTGCERSTTGSSRLLIARSRRSPRSPGAAVGAGLNLALAADVAYRRPGRIVRSAIPEARHPPRRRRHVDAAANPSARRWPGRRLVVRHAIRRRIGRAPRVGAVDRRRSGGRRAHARRSRPRGRAARRGDRARRPRCGPPPTPALSTPNTMRSPSTSSSAPRPDPSNLPNSQRVWPPPSGSSPLQAL